MREGRQRPFLFLLDFAAFLVYFVHEFSAFSGHLSVKYRKNNWLS